MIEVGSIVQTGKMWWWHSPVHEVREYNGETYCLLYYRDSDGPLAGWWEASKLTVVDTSKVAQKDMDESIKYRGPWAVEKLCDPEFAWGLLLESFNE